MNNELTEAIRRETADYYPEDRFNVSVKALHNFLFLVGKDSRLKEEDLLEMITGSLKVRQSAALKWGNIETVLKEFCRTVFPAEYMKNSGDGIKLESIYKDMLHLVPELVPETTIRFSLTKADPEKCFKQQDTVYRKYPFIGQLVNLYQCRNETVVHGIDDLSPGKLNKVITDICVVLLYLCFRYSDAIGKKAGFQRFYKEMPSSWKKERDLNYKKLLERTGYVDFRWTANDICTTEQITFLNSPVLENEKYIKLLGNAGSGKTTALLHIQHLFLENFSSLELVPIFYELKDLCVMRDSLIAYIVSESLSISEDAAKELIETEKLIFLFDGYNEILDINIRRKFSIELEQFTALHKSVRVIITDRNYVNEITVLQKQSKCFTLKSFTYEDYDAYFRKNCDDRNVLDLLEEALKNEDKAFIFEPLTTPLKLYNFTMMAKEQGMVPEDFTAEYLQQLFDRERNEKKDPNLDVLEDYLKALTSLTGLENSLVEKNQILALMAKVDSLLGYKNYNTLEALRLARDMGILREETIEGNRRPKTYYQFEDENYYVFYSELLFDDDVLFENFGSDES